MSDPKPKDLTSEDPAPAEVPAPVEATDEQQVALKALEAEVADLKDRLLRQMAETENVRKRADRERQEAARFGIAPFARDLMPVADNLLRAILSVPVERRADEAVSTLIAGIELTEKDLMSAFEKHGLKRIHPDGEPFDANYHQAVAEAPGAAKAGTVLTVIQSGYKIDERLIRPALVVISKGPGATAPPPQGEGGGPGSHVDTSA